MASTLLWWLLNWLLIGALLVPLRVLFPQVRMFEYAAGAPGSLLGIAFAACGVDHADGLHRKACDAGRDLRGQTRILGKSVLWATPLMCLASGLQGAPWATSVLFCGAGLLHFGALWAWRWQRARQSHRAQQFGDVRNVLIVGAGGVGRRVAAYVEEHPEVGRTVCGFLGQRTAAGQWGHRAGERPGPAGAHGICG